MPSRRYTNSAVDILTETLPSGYTAAEKVVTRGCGPRKALAVRLLYLVRTSGFQGVPALEFFAECLLWNLTGSESVPIAGGKLTSRDAEMIRDRARVMSIALLADAEPYSALVASERLGLDPFDHLPIGAR